MALVGDLKDLALVDIIQINCVGRNTARLTVNYPTGEGVFFFQDGEVVDTVALTRTSSEAGSASFTLDPEADATYVLVASGSSPMTLAYPGEYAWSMTAALRIDVAGDGWTPPLPPLKAGE